MSWRQLSLMVCLISWLATACTASGGQLVADGNEAFAEAAYDEALSHYQAAQQVVPERPEPAYNAANALYRQQAYEEAEALLQAALAQADEGLAVLAFYNLGNAAFLMEGWETAVDAYKNALRLDPDHEGAKYNLELALAQLQAQEQASEPEEEAAPETQEPPEQQDEREDQEADEPQQEQSESGENEAAPNEEVPPEEGEEAQSSQESLEDEAQTEAQPDEAEPSQSEGASDAAANEDNEAVGPPQEAVEGLTDEQARQLLEAISANTETLQERLQDVFTVEGDEPARDW